jgi:hypothetical protein
LFAQSARLLSVFSAIISPLWHLTSISDAPLYLFQPCSTYISPLLVNTTYWSGDHHLAKILCQYLFGWRCLNIRNLSRSFRPCENYKFDDHFLPWTNIP